MLKTLNRLCSSILGKQDLPINVINTSKQSVSYPPYVDFSVPVFNDGELQRPAWIDDLQDISKEIALTKYSPKDRDGKPTETDVFTIFKRISKALSAIEPNKQDEWERAFLWALNNGATPAGRIMSNAGLVDVKGSTSTINCTVSGTIPDSAEGIMEIAKKATKTLKYGCGIGYDFSTIRPDGYYIHGVGATTSGALSYMDVFDTVCKIIASDGGRRGAQMAAMDVLHPEILSYIKAKREPGKFRQFNLSVLITDEFLTAVKNELPWDLIFPVRDKDFTYLTDSEFNLDDLDVKNELMVNGQKFIVAGWAPMVEPPKKDGDDYIKMTDGRYLCHVQKTISAVDIWEAIMESTYLYSDPGLIMIDRMNRYNNLWFDELIRTTNPCVPDDTWVTTSLGPRQVKDLINKPCRIIVNGQGYDSYTGFFPTGEKDVYDLITKEGYTVSLTEDHRVLVSTDDGSDKWVEAGKLQPGDQVVLNDTIGTQWGGVGDYDDGYLIGHWFGDGYWNTDRKKGVLQVNLVPGTESVVDRINSIINNRTGSLSPYIILLVGLKGREVKVYSSTQLTNLINVLNMVKPGSTEKWISPELEKTSVDFYKGFMSGFFDTDGTVQCVGGGRNSLRLNQSNQEVLLGVQRMLLRLGIQAKLYKRRDSGYRQLPDGKGGHKDYFCKENFELIIASDNIDIFRNLCNLHDGKKRSILRKLANTIDLRITDYKATVAGLVKRDEKCQVFDINVTDVHRFDGNGIIIHNCGEVPLPPDASCLLGSVNLIHCVNKPFTKDASFDWVKFRKIVRIFSRMLDNVVEINNLPLPEQDESIRRKRRHGMGYLGLGSALTMLGIKYGSDDAVSFTTDVTAELAITGFETGVQLAIEKSPAPIMDEDFVIDEHLLFINSKLKSEWDNSGYSLKGKELLANYSKYMEIVGDYRPDLLDDIVMYGSRYSHATSIAPTGSVSLSFGNNASNGIEPTFAHQYFRNIIVEGKATKQQSEVCSYEFLLYRKLIDPNATVETLPEYFVTAMDIKPIDHVRMQAAAQIWIDSSISKTINLPTDFTYEESKDIYMKAYELGLKGCTTYRYNPDVRTGVLVTKEDLESTWYEFELEDGTVVGPYRASDEVTYDGAKHNVGNLAESIKEGQYGKF